MCVRSAVYANTNVSYYYGECGTNTKITNIRHLCVKGYNKKWAKDLNKEFTEKEMQMTNKYKKMLKLSSI